MPAVTLTIRDETASGDVYHELPLEFPSERITVRELIRERVYQEVQDFNRRNDEYVFRGLVQPTDAEKILNGNRTEYRLKKRREINWKQQFEKATDAFARNGFFVLVDNKQAASLDEQFTIGRDTEVSFVRLMPLVGG
ncbi:MAG TPA: hypothetical protein VH518_16620 [Tepidisphaeraceae bacterium]|jgi:hypothetical protein